MTTSLYSLDLRGRVIKYKKAVANLSNQAMNELKRIKGEVSTYVSTNASETTNPLPHDVVKTKREAMSK